jgi:hypothetical protein
MTTTSGRTSYDVRPIAPAVLDVLRVRDDAGREPRFVADTDGGSPLRCCLRPSRPGERLALVSYAPLRRWAAETGADPGPYDEVGPVFIHPEPCAGTAAAGYPEALRDSRRMLRAYAADGHILLARLIEPDGQAEAELGALFADPDVAVVHARALEFGCFTFEVRRAV